MPFIYDIPVAGKTRQGSQTIQLRLANESDILSDSRKPHFICGYDNSFTQGTVITHLKIDKLRAIPTTVNNMYCGKSELDYTAIPRDEVKNKGLVEYSLDSTINSTPLYRFEDSKWTHFVLTNPLSNAYPEGSLIEVVDDSSTPRTYYFTIREYVKGSNSLVVYGYFPILDDLTFNIGKDSFNGDSVSYINILLGDTPKTTITLNTPLVQDFNNDTLVTITDKSSNNWKYYMEPYSKGDLSIVVKGNTIPLMLNIENCSISVDGYGIIDSGIIDGVIHGSLIPKYTLIYLNTPINYSFEENDYLQFSDPNAQNGVISFPIEQYRPYDSYIKVKEDLSVYGFNRNTLFSIYSGDYNINKDSYNVSLSINLYTKVYLASPINYSLSSDSYIEFEGNDNSTHRFTIINYTSGDPYLYVYGNLGDYGFTITTKFSVKDTSLFSLDNNSTCTQVIPAPLIINIFPTSIVKGYKDPIDGNTVYTIIMDSNIPEDIREGTQGVLSINSNQYNVFLGKYINESIGTKISSKNEKYLLSLDNNELNATRRKRTGGLYNGNLLDIYVDPNNAYTEGVNIDSLIKYITLTQSNSNNISPFNSNNYVSFGNTGNNVASKIKSIEFSNMQNNFSKLTFLESVEYLPDNSFLTISYYGNNFNFPILEHNPDVDGSSIVVKGCLDSFGIEPYGIESTGSGFSIDTNNPITSSSVTTMTLWETISQMPYITIAFKINGSGDNVSSGTKYVIIKQPKITLNSNGTFNLYYVDYKIKFRSNEFSSGNSYTIKSGSDVYILFGKYIYNNTPGKENIDSYDKLTGNSSYKFQDPIENFGEPGNDIYKFNIGNDWVLSDSGDPLGFNEIIKDSSELWKYYHANTRIIINGNTSGYSSLMSKYYTKKNEVTVSLGGTTLTPIDYSNIIFNSENQYNEEDKNLDNSSPIWNKATLINPINKDIKEDSLLVVYYKGKRYSYKVGHAKSGSTQIIIKGNMKDFEYPLTNQNTNITESSWEGIEFSYKDQFDIIDVGGNNNIDGYDTIIDKNKLSSVTQYKDHPKLPNIKDFIENHKSDIVDDIEDSNFGNIISNPKYSLTQNYKTRTHVTLDYDLIDIAKVDKVGFNLASMQVSVPINTELTSDKNVAIFTPDFKKDINNTLLDWYYNTNPDSDSILVPFLTVRQKSTGYIFPRERTDISQGGNSLFDGLGSYRTHLTQLMGLLSLNYNKFKFNYDLSTEIQKSIMRMCDTVAVFYNTDTVGDIKVGSYPSPYIYSNDLRNGSDNSMTYPARVEVEGYSVVKAQVAQGQILLPYSNTSRIIQVLKFNPFSASNNDSDNNDLLTIKGTEVFVNVNTIITYTYDNDGNPVWNTENDSRITENIMDTLRLHGPNTIEIDTSFLPGGHTCYGDNSSPFPTNYYRGVFLKDKEFSKDFVYVVRTASVGSPPNNDSQIDYTYVDKYESGTALSLKSYLWKNNGSAYLKAREFSPYWNYPFLSDSGPTGYGDLKYQNIDSDLASLQLYVGILLQSFDDNSFKEYGNYFINIALEWFTNIWKLSHLNKHTTNENFGIYETTPKTSITVNNPSPQVMWINTTTGRYYTYISRDKSTYYLSDFVAMPNLIPDYIWNATAENVPAVFASNSIPNVQGNYPAVHLSFKREGYAIFKYESSLFPIVTLAVNRQPNIAPDIGIIEIVLTDEAGWRYSMNVTGDLYDFDTSNIPTPTVSQSNASKEKTKGNYLYADLFPNESMLPDPGQSDSSAIVPKIGTYPFVSFEIHGNYADVTLVWFNSTSLAENIFKGGIIYSIGADDKFDISINNIVDEAQPYQGAFPGKISSNKMNPNYNTYDDSTPYSGPISIIQQAPIIYAIDNSEDYATTVVQLILESQKEYVRRVRKKTVTKWDGQLDNIPSLFYTGVVPTYVYDTNSDSMWMEEDNKIGFSWKSPVINWSDAKVVYRMYFNLACYWKQTCDQGTKYPDSLMQIFKNLVGGIQYLYDYVYAYGGSDITENTGIEVVGSYSQYSESLQESDSTLFWAGFGKDGPTLGYNLGAVCYALSSLILAYLCGMKNQKTFDCINRLINTLYSYSSSEWWGDKATPHYGYDSLLSKEWLYNAVSNTPKLKDFYILSGEDYGILMYVLGLIDTYFNDVDISDASLFKGKYLSNLQYEESKYNDLGGSGI